MIISFFGHADFIENEEYKERFMKFLDETVGDKTADFTLFCIKREWGGAHKTYLYAKRKKKNIFNIAEQILNTESFKIVSGAEPYNYYFIPQKQSCNPSDCSFVYI